MPYYLSGYAGTPSVPRAVTAGEAVSAELDEWYLGKDFGTRAARPRASAGEWALVWSSIAVSGAGIFLLANNADDVLTNPRRNAINTQLGTAFPAGTTLRQVLRYLLRQEPRRFRQVPIEYDGSCWVTLGPLTESFNQDDDPVQALDPPEAASYPPLNRG